MSVSNPQSPTPPLHAEVRAAVLAIVAKHDNDYYSQAMDLLEPEVRQFVEGTSWAGELHKAEVDKLRTQEICQALAEALLAAIQPLKDRPEKYVRMNSECLEGHTIALDAVTRVIGELGGPVSNEGAGGNSK